MQTCALSWTQSTDESLTALTKELSSARPWRQASLLRPLLQVHVGCWPGRVLRGRLCRGPGVQLRGCFNGVGQKERRGQRQSCTRLSPPSMLPVSATCLPEKDAEKKAAGQQDRMPQSEVQTSWAQEALSQRNQTQSSTKSATAIKGSVDRVAHVFKVRTVLP